MRRAALSLPTLIGFAAIVRMTACLQSSVSPQPDASAPPGLDGSQGIFDATSGPPDVTVAPDAAAPDATVAQDASSPGDAGLDAPADAVVYTYSALSDSTKYAAFSPPSPDGGTIEYVGGAYDRQRYVYFVPSASGLLTRYDTTGSFTSAASWTVFDLTTVDPTLDGFDGAAFDGHYLYLAPGGSTTVRFDTTQSFTSAASYTSFSLATLVDAGPAPQVFNGAAYDGHFVYYVPDLLGADCIAVRYDPTGSFTAASSWSTYNVSQTGAPGGFAGVSFDTRYLYLSPWGNAATDPLSVIARFDTTAPFAADASWSTFDTSTLDAGNGLPVTSFWGSLFDGHYVYFSPSARSPSGGTVVRYDPSQPFGAAGAWATFVLTNVAPGNDGMFGMTFDGRYLYFVPSNSAQLSLEGLFARYDTTLPFTAASSWESYDLTAVSPVATGLGSAVFDGQNVYLVPFFSGAVVRFAAKSPSGLPAGYGASFY
jgi:hypothetical protein